MKLRKIAAGLLAAAGSLLLAGSVAACLGAVNRPAAFAPHTDGVRDFAQEFLDTLDRGDFAGVEKCLYGSPDLGLEKAPDTESGKQLWQAYRDSVSVEYSDYCYSKGTNIYQSAKVTALDISAAMGKLNSTAAEILKSTLETAEDPNALLNEDGTIPDTLRQQALSQALTQVLSEGTTVTREMNVRLVKQDGQWWVVPDGALLAVLSAGLN